MSIVAQIEKRILECNIEHEHYTDWLRKLRLPNALLVGVGSLLAFLGGAAVLTTLVGPTLGGAMALSGGVLTGLHTWFGCDAHQAECRELSGKFESLKSRYETVQGESDNARQIEMFRELESELAIVKEQRKTRPWKGFLDLGTRT